MNLKFHYYNSLRKLGDFLQKISFKLVSFRHLNYLNKRYFSKIPVINRFYQTFLMDYSMALADFFLISYPKCGRTWLRSMIGSGLIKHFKLMSDDRDLLDVEYLAAKYNWIPRIKVMHDRHSYSGRIFGNGLNPYNTIDEIPTIKPKHVFGNKKVILLVRDPRDAIVSYYFQAVYRDRYFNGNLSSFIHDDRLGIGPLLKHYIVWISNKDVPQDIIIVRYEDLIKSPVFELKKIFNFISLNNFTSKELNEIVETNSFNNMKKREAERKFGYELKPGDLKNPESFKVRKGEIGGYVHYLNTEDIEYLNDKINALLPPEYGYYATREKIREEIAL